MNSAGPSPKWKRPSSTLTVVSGPPSTAPPAGVGGRRSAPLCGTFGDAWCLVDRFVLRFRRVDVGQSAFKHGIVLEDIEHAVRNAMAIDDLDEDLRLYLGPTRRGSLLEVIAWFETATSS